MSSPFEIMAALDKDRPPVYDIEIARALFNHFGPTKAQEANDYINKDSQRLLDILDERNQKVKELEDEVKSLQDIVDKQPSI